MRYNFFNLDSFILSNNHLKHISLFILLSILAGCSLTAADQSDIDKGSFTDLNNNYKPLKLGQPVPLFTLPNATGTPISLADINKDKAVLIIFYRGSWCPYCIDQLNSVQAFLPEMQALGVQVVAITPDENVAIQNTQRQFDQGFIFLSDPKANVIKEYGIDRLNNLPHPATFLVAKGGELLWFYASTDHTKRPNGEQLLQVIKKNSSKL